MQVIAFIEIEDVIKKILKHLGLWEKIGIWPRQPIKTYNILNYQARYVSLDDNTYFWNVFNVN